LRARYGWRLRMKILLQHKKTGFYLQLPTDWTPDPSAATDFRTSESAIACLRESCLVDVQVVAVFLSGTCVETVCYQLDAAHARSRIRA
jgi:hypothetical protein